MGLHLVSQPHRSGGRRLTPHRPSSRIPAPPPGVSTTGGLIVRRVGSRETLVAVRPFEAGELVFAFAHVAWRPTRDRLTVEDPKGRHIYDPLLARMAHGCDPNCRPCFELMAMIARRDIAKGETLAFDYLSTESAICEPFDCQCGAPACRGRIQRAASACSA
jgi:hypothetical protein